MILWSVTGVAYQSMKVSHTSAHYSLCVPVVCAGCYGVPEEDGVDQNRSSLSSFTTIPWFCDACKAGVSPTSCVSYLSVYYCVTASLFLPLSSTVNYVLQ